MEFFSSAADYVREIYTNRLPFFPSNIKTALLIILFCLIATVELYIFIAYRRLLQYREKRKKKYYSERIGNLLTHVFNYEENEDVDEFVERFRKRFKKLPLKDPLVNRILTNEIMVYHKNLTGTLKVIFEKLYHALKLDKWSKRRMANKHWERKIEGIREANELKLKDLLGDISNYTDDEESLLRMEAQAAFLKLSKDNPFQFLDRAQERILDWHQVVLFEVITKSKDIEIPSFAKWLSSSNPTVVLLCLRLIEHFMQFDAVADIEKLLKHPSPTIVKKAVQVLGTLEIESAEQAMFEIYFDQSIEIKIEILKSLGKISSGSYNDFLLSRIYSNEYLIKREAMYAVKKMPKIGRVKLQELYRTSTEENKALIKHVLDERIKDR